ncbi:MAG: EAL domain-containing protein [Pseudolabrys sp.]
MTVKAHVDRVKRFVMRHRVSLQDAGFILATVIIVAYLLFEFDIFVAPGASVVEKTIELDELALLGAVVCLGLLAFAWRRLNEQKRETRKRIAAEQRARELAFQDPLTGLPNRRQFADALKVAVAAPPHAGGVHCLLMLDLNGFKQINDVYGHGTGDEALSAVGERLLTSLGHDDLVARLGGDEFAILAQHLAGPEAATGVALRVAGCLAEPLRLSGTLHQVAAGIGICLFPFTDCNSGEIMRRADVALYKAKANRETSMRFFDQEMDRLVREREFMERELRAAVIAEEIEPVFEPLVDLITKEVVGFEAVGRWTHRDLGDVPVDRFIPIAEDSGLIRSLSDQVLRNACRAACEWPSAVMLSFNISSVLLKDSAFGLRILGILGETGLSPNRLEIALSENALVRDLGSAQQALGPLRQAGIRIALNDFGTGYSSLYHLRNFKLDKIKIDRSFIKNMSTERESDAIVNALVGLGKGLGFTISAEGIDGAGQESALLARGFQQAQGHLFGDPLSADSARNLVTQQRQATAAG